MHLLSPGTTKNMHFLHYHTTSPQLCNSCAIICSRVVVSFVATSVSSVVLGNNVLNILNGIILPLQPVSTLYGTIIAACLDNVFSFATILKLFELNLIEFILNLCHVVAHECLLSQLH